MQLFLARRIVVPLVLSIPHDLKESGSTHPWSDATRVNGSPSETGIDQNVSVLVDVQAHEPQCTQGTEAVSWLTPG